MSNPSPCPPLRVTIWNEYRHERLNETCRALYPDGMHETIAEALRPHADLQVRTATLDSPDCGLDAEMLASTDVLTIWGHRAHSEVDDAAVERVCARVLEGMGLIVLHSGHFSKIFKRLMGTACSLRWRMENDRERLWNLAPNHPITQGIGDCIEIPHHEMYGERFDIPTPDELIFISWYSGGEVFRSGCTWQRGYGKIFYFSPGHETCPVYHDPKIQRVLLNAVRWARPCGYPPPTPANVPAPEMIRSTSSNS
ncbi:MAG TPA: ThuA domain-containing protein [Chthoniobacteraceae bacterium]|nr:ThuA domain-containing protein [Chthoniobacteraceae bacterium]